MNEEKLQRLIGAARAEPAPEVSPGFEARLMHALRRDERSNPASLFDQLGELFPTVSLAAALVIGLCVAADLCLSTLGPMDLSEGVTQVSEQWLFAVK
jgi:hypothetical protein